MRQSPAKCFFFSFPLFLSLSLVLYLLIFFTERAMAQNTSTIPVNVGVILDVNSEFGKIWLRCINMALSDFYANNSYYKTRVVLNTRDSKRDVIGAATAALDLIKNVEVQAIIGPDKSMQTNFVIELGNKAKVPILSFTATSPSITSIRSPYFFRCAYNDSSQVGAITAIVQAFGWRLAVPIYVDSEFGEGVIPYLTDALQAINTHVPYRSAIPPQATDDQIVEELYKLMTMQTRVFIVHMLPSLGSRLFVKAKEVGMMSEGYVWIMTNGLTNLLTSLEPSVIDSMQGVLGVRPYVPRTKAIENFRVRWRRKFHQENPTFVDAELNIFGLLAYDATMALAMAFEEAGTKNFGFDKTNMSTNPIDLEAFGVSQDGPKLLQALSSTRFRGLTGDYMFVDRQLQSLASQIVNVNDDGTRGIGFWTPQKGLTRKLFLENMNSTSKSNLGTVIWPGDSTSVPKGWEIPTNDKKLRIGVPVKEGFSDFVKVTTDPRNEKPIVTGYCIDVFDAVMHALPYAVPYEFIPFGLANGTSSGSYNDLIYQVVLGKFDAVVGDITIVANRSRDVDFTLPYTESGVSMIVPIKLDSNKENAWVFWKPLTRDLWVTSACFFVFIVFIFWLLERRITGHQAGTNLLFPLSTMDFSDWERVISNLARFVVIIVWCSLVLILSQSYTASLTSLLTVERLQPSVTDVKELIRRGENVGYQRGSFVLGILKELGFNEKKLIVYNSPEECDALFQKGTPNGGIAAAFDEVPYIKLFLGKYCSKYTMVEPTFKTAGFGFAFLIGSPLASDVSRAILNVTEGEKMNKIEDAWFKKNSCPDPSPSVSSYSLDLNSFWGLFVIAGSAAILALVVVMATFICMHWKDPEYSRASFWTRTFKLLRKFVSADHSGQTSNARNGVHVHNNRGASTSSPRTHYPNGVHYDN